MLSNGKLSDVNMDNGIGQVLIVAVSAAGQLGCVRVLLDHLESSTIELIGERSASDYHSSGVAYITRGKHRFLKMRVPCESDTESENEGESNVARTESLVLVACHRRYHHTP